MNSQTSACGGTGYTVTTTIPLINSVRLLYTVLTVLQIIAFTTSVSDRDQIAENVNFYRLEKNITSNDSLRIEFSNVRNRVGAEKVNVFSRKDGDKSNRINVIGEWGDSSLLKEKSNREEIEKSNYYRGNSSYYRHLEVENDGKEFELMNTESEKLNNYRGKLLNDDKIKKNYEKKYLKEQEKFDIENKRSNSKLFNKRSLKSFSEESTSNLTESGKQVDNFISFPRSNTSFTSISSRPKPSELPIVDDGLTLEVDPPVYEGYHLNNTNCTNDYCASDEDYFDMIRQYMLPTPYEWVLVALNAAVFVVGLVGNALVCVAVYRNHSMRTVTNYFIVNLAVADFMVILFCLPPTVLWDVTETWFMGTALCKIVLYVQTVSIAVSVLTLTFISVDRWYAICFPLKFKSTTGRAKTAIIIIWMLALTFDIPELVVLTTEKRVPHLDMVYFTQCKATWSPESDRMWATAKMVVLYALPLAFMSFAYYQIARVLWKSDNIPGHTENSVMIQHNCRVSSNTSRRSAMNNTSTEGQLRSRRKAAKMLVAIVVMFAVCYFPVYLIWLLKLIVKIPNTDGYRVLSMLSHWLCYANSAMNPIIYNFMSGKFRQEFRRDFSQCLCNKRAKNYDTFRLRSLPTRATKCNNDYRTNGATEATKFCAYRDVSTKRHRPAATIVNNGGGAVIRQTTTQTTSSGGGLNPRVANHAQNYVSEDTNQGSFKMAVRTEHV